MRKKIYMLMICLMAGYAVSNAQVSTTPHPTVKSFALRFEDGNTGAVSASMDSSVIIIYVVAVNDTNTVNKIHVRISSGNATTGNLLSTNYVIHSAPVVDAQGKTLFIRDKDVISIRTIATTQLADNNFEVYTEDFQGQLSPALNWEK